MFSLKYLQKVRQLMVAGRLAFYRRIYGMDLHPTVQCSLNAHFDRTWPKGVHVGPYSWVATGAIIFTHDRTRGIYADTWVGANCFIGARSILLPGVRVGDNCIVAAGAVVTKDVPPRSVVAGNPAAVINSDIDVVEYGRMRTADETTRRLQVERDAAAAASSSSGQAR